MKRKLHGKIKLGAVLLAAAVIGLIVLIRVQAFPAIQEMARMRVDSTCTTTINDAINQQIAVGEIDYDKLVSLDKDLNGNIAALKTNMSEVNRLKTEILDIINDKIVEQTVDELVRLVTTNVLVYTSDDDYLAAVRVLLGDRLEQALKG